MKTEPDYLAVGQAIICPDARYASLMFLGASRIERRFAAPAQWRELKAVLTRRISRAPLPPDHVVPSVLLGANDRHLVCWHPEVCEVSVTSPARAVASLDEMLRAEIAMAESLRHLK
jgi:hypothetical protein